LSSNRASHSPGTLIDLCQRIVVVFAVSVRCCRMSGARSCGVSMWFPRSALPLRLRVAKKVARSPWPYPGGRGVRL